MWCGWVSFCGGYLIVIVFFLMLVILHCGDAGDAIICNANCTIELGITDV